MKKELFLSILFLTMLWSNVIYAQDTTSFSGRFDRPSITPLLLNHEGDRHDQQMVSAFDSIEFGHKFFYNDIGYNDILAGGKKEDYDILGKKNIGNENLGQNIKKKVFNIKKINVMGFLQDLTNSGKSILPPTDSMGIAIGNNLESMNIGGQVFSIWVDTSLLNKRSDYNLASYDIRNESDGHKLDNFKGLFFKNFILVYDMAPLLVKIDEEGSKSYKTTFAVYVYKLNIDNAIFDKVIKPNATPENVGKIKKYPFPIKYMGKYLTDVRTSESDFALKNSLKNVMERDSTRKKKSWKDRITVTKQTTNKGVLVSNETKTLSGKSLDLKIGQEEIGDWVFRMLSQSGYDKTTNLLERDLDDFKVKANIVGALPIRIEIGVREGVKPDQRYWVYRSVEKNGVTKNEKIGVIRASGHIANNLESRKGSDGKFLTTKFKQTYGKILREGMFVEQFNDLGGTLSLGFGLRNFKLAEYLGEPGAMKSIDFHVDYNIAGYVKRMWPKSTVSGLNGYFGFSYGSFKVSEKEKYKSMNFQFGLAKRIYLMKMLNLYPYFGIAIETAHVHQKNESSAKYQGAFFNVDMGLRAFIPITPVIFIEPTIGFPFIGISRDATYEGPYYQGVVQFALAVRFEF